MYRSLEKAIRDYDSMVSRSGSAQRYEFYVSDITQIIEMSDDLADVVINALKSGFMIGYRAAVRDKEGGK